MLVLSRTIGEAIIIDGCIRVTITPVKGNQVRIGITAPPDVSVDREEVARRRGAYTDPECFQDRTSLPVARSQTRMFPWRSPVKTDLASRLKTALSLVRAIPVGCTNPARAHKALL